MDSDEEDLKNTADAIRERKKLIIQAHRLEHNRNRAILPKKSALKNANLKAMGEKLSKHGLDPNAAVQSTRALGKKRSRSETEADEAVKEADADIRDEVMAREMSNLGFRNVKVRRNNDISIKVVSPNVVFYSFIAKARSRQAKEAYSNTIQQVWQTWRIRSSYPDQDAKALVQWQDFHGFSRPSINNKKIIHTQDHPYYTHIIFISIVSFFCSLMSRMHISNKNKCICILELQNDAQ